MILGFDIIALRTYPVEVFVLNDEFKNENTEHGNVKISNEVISIIAGVAANEIDGVVSMSGGITGGITEMLGMKNLSKGVKVDINEKEANIDIFITVEYGIKISEIGVKVQKNVKDTVENMTGLEVKSVNVNIQDISFPKEIQEEED